MNSPGIDNNIPSHLAPNDGTVAGHDALVVKRKAETPIDSHRDAQVAHKDGRDVVHQRALDRDRENFFRDLYTTSKLGSHEGTLNEITERHRNDPLWALLKLSGILATIRGPEGATEDFAQVEGWAKTTAEILIQCIECKSLSELSERSEEVWDSEWKPYTPRVSSPPYEHPWNSTYQGDCLHLFLNQLKKIQDVADARITPIIQSSGTGKSRMVDELAKLVFTIPINVRAPEEEESGAYPPSDSSLRRTLTKIRTEDEARIFFGVLFSQVLAALSKLKEHKIMADADIAKEWRKHLVQHGPDGSTHRAALYDEVSDKFNTAYTTHKASKTPLQHDPSFVPLSKLLRSFPDSRCQLVVYIDEAHTLTNPNLANGLSVYNHIHSAWCKYAWHHPTVHLVSLSTDSSIAVVAPTVVTYSSARIPSITGLVAPWTEMPSEPFVQKKMVKPGQNDGQVCNIEFLAKFGRPLFHTFLQSNQHPDKVNRLFALLKKKLLGTPPTDIFKHHHKWTLAQRYAVLELLVKVSSEPLLAVQSIKRELVAGHMCMAVSISQSGESFTAGYTSEPVLAAAAIRICDDAEEAKQDFLADTLACQEFNSHHVDYGKRGENVAKILFIRAYMKAVVTERCEADPISVKERDQTLDLDLDKPSQPTFCESVPLITFIKELFPPKHAKAILASKPCNVSTGKTLGDCFQKARVRFNHFVQGGSDIVATSTGAWGGYVRGVAFQGWDSQELFDLFIPISLDPTNLRESTTSLLLVQVKLPGDTTHPSQWQHMDEAKIRVFPEKGKRENTDEETPRPYITLFLDLRSESIHPPPQLEIDKLDQAESKRKSKQSSSQAPASPAESPPAVQNDPSVTVGDVVAKHDHSVTDAGQPQRLSTQDQDHWTHPRYVAHVVGCSDKVYKVISSEYSETYANLLREANPHHRSDLQRVVEWKADSFGWLNSPFLNQANSDD